MKISFYMFLSFFFLISLSSHYLKVLCLNDDELGMVASIVTNTNDTMIISSLLSTSTTSPQSASDNPDYQIDTIPNNAKKNQMAQFVRNQIKKEIRKMKSSITDSVLEEVISYYGKKIEMNDALKQEIETLNKKYSSLQQNLNTLGQNYKSISKNHRNLVDIVRNNLINLKKEKEVSERNKHMHANKTPIKFNGVNRNGDSSTNINEIIKRKAALDAKNNDKNKLKIELINDLETKYVDLMNEKLADVILKNLNGNNNNNTSSTKMITTTVNSNDSRKLVIRHDNQVDDESDDDIDNDDSDSTRITVSNQNKMPTDCQDLLDRGFNNNGVYKLVLPNFGNNTIEAYCEFENNVGWTVLQNRFDGSVNFYQNWNEYKNGFGNMIEDGEFWLGLDNIHALTYQNNYSLQIVLIDWKNEKYTAEYENFKVEDEKSKYRLELTNYLKNLSNAGDSFGDSLDTTQTHHNMLFSTYDSDNDLRFYDNCAQLFKSGWWFNACFQSNLNGVYYKYSNESANRRSAKPEENSQLRFLRNGIHWNSIDFYKSLKSTKMRIRRRNVFN